MKFNRFKLIVVACALFGSMAWATEEPNDIIGAAYSSYYATEDFGSCPSWFTALHRNSTDTHTNETITVELDGCQIIDVTVITFEQNSAPEPVDLETDDLFIVWDEDAGHGSTIDFSFTGTYAVADPNTNCNYARVSSSNDDIINWVLYKVTADGTLTINSTGLNEHDIFQLQRNYIDFDKIDNVNDLDCVVPAREFQYTICFNNDTDDTVYDAFIIDYLPEGVTYPQGAYTFDPNTMTIIPPDPGYNPEEHYYVWELGTIGPGDVNCVTLDVVVNDKALPGTYLHNVAELWADSGNSLLARATEDTLVCCWGDPNFIYVDQTATGNNTGMSWRDAYVDLADALERAANTNCGITPTVYVAQGIYDPNETPDKTFVLPENCAVYGGFISGGCDFSERNPKKYKTILTGLIDGDVFPDAETLVEMRQDSLLDGFTVTNAYINAVYGNGADFTISQCTIEKSFQYGIYAKNGAVDIQWCNIRLNDKDGIRHEGAGHSLSVSTSWILRNGECGIICENSIPIVKNSIVSESDLTEQGRAGILLQNPSYPPVLHNLTISNNKEVGIYFADDGDITGDPNNPDYPDLQNSIVYYNNPGGRQLAGFNADTIANFCCIQDCNEPGTTNYNSEPGFAYVVDPNGAPDPNNYHLAYNAFCIDKANPYLSYTNQVDIDGEGLDRKYGDYVDIGADEVYDCSDEILTDIDVHNDLDRDADGIVNFAEYAPFAAAWLSRDPNDPSLPTDPNLIDPNDFVGWSPSCNYDATGLSAYTIDLADLDIFLDNWLWVACWKLEEIEAAAAQSQSQSMIMQSFPMMTMETIETEPEPSLDTLVQIVGFLDKIATENPDNIENIQELRAYLMDEIWVIWSRQNE